MYGLIVMLFSILWSSTTWLTSNCLRLCNSSYFGLKKEVQVFKKGIVIHTFNKVGDIFGEKRFLDNFSRAETVSSDGKTICLAIDTSAKARIWPEADADRLVKILYLIIAEFLSVRLREANEKLIKCKMKNIVLRAKLEDLTS